MRKVRVTNGVFWVEIPEVDLRVLCGCPADAIKHLIIAGLVAPTTRSGVPSETGPNAILLSDLPVQGGSFANLAEFPVLQMLYRQGMILPGHPNNDGRRPMLIGVEDQLRAQAAYIFRGTYGLASLDELQATGIGEAQAREIWRWKLRFAFDRIRDTDALLDLRVAGRGPVELAAGVTLERRGLNRYAFHHAGETVEVDLTLTPGEEYLPPYRLPPRTIPREFFSVVHIGEGDGWNPRRPCMASLLCHQGRFYLVDAGPGITHALDALGITANEIDGIFQTHGHDDHFAGLTSLARADHRIAYYAAAPVRDSVERKLCALMEIGTARFRESFEVIDLALDEWTSIRGLEVKPVAAPHPVDNTVLLFRALGPGGYRTYAHLADIPSLPVLDRMVNDDPSVSGVSAAYRDRFRELLREPADVKKVDAGGGPIHGEASDFAADASRRLLISHTDAPLTPRQIATGEVAEFGEVDVLIRAENDAETVGRALRYLGDYFPTVAHHELEVLANCPVAGFAAGSPLVSSGEVRDEVLFLLGGIVEARDPAGGPSRRLSTGALIGEITAIAGVPARRTHVAVSGVTVLRIPLVTCREFIRRNGLIAEMLRLRDLRRFLETASLFADTVSFRVLNRAARALVIRSARAGDEPSRNGCLALLLKGRVVLATMAGTVEELAPGGFWGEDELLCRTSPVTARAVTDVSFALLPASEVAAIPIVAWKLLEACDRRRKDGNGNARAGCSGAGV